MEAEIREQPARLAANVSRYSAELRESFGGQSFEMALLVARGTSDHAALYGRYLMEINLGIPVSLAAPSVLTRYGVRIRYPKCLAIGISQSGAAPDVAEVLSALRQDGHSTLAITNTSDSRITEAAEFSLILEAGPEQSVAATKTYSTSLLALHELVRALGGALPEPDLPKEDWLETTRDASERQLGYIVRNPVLFALGRGFSFCTAQETALKLMECAILPCKSYSTADFQHGPKALAGPGSAAIVYGEAIPELAAQGCQVVQAPPAPDSVPDALRPIWDIFFGQWLALGAARARNFDPDHPQFIQKVTETR
ncbi:MAG TPA: SIS domain-containing protein [Fimbriimonadaceae bacterium]|nr:SIS domain-containing protein [Fimbriimonadaceae bacterium]